MGNKGNWQQWFQFYHRNSPQQGKHISKGFALIKDLLLRACGRDFGYKILAMDFVSVWILKIVVQKCQLWDIYLSNSLWMKIRATNSSTGSW